MTILDIDGNLKYNIYGQKINNATTNHLGFYSKVVFYNDKILALFANGKDRYSNKESEYPTQFLIFNTKGDYIKTLETEYAIIDFCYDEDNNRLIMHLDEDIQFAYLELDGIILRLRFFRTKFMNTIHALNKVLCQVLFFLYLAFHSFNGGFKKEIYNNFVSMFFSVKIQ